jgi:site-specific DNA recombinase
MKTAAIYSRLSTVRRGEEPVSLDTQEHDCIATAKRLGYAPQVYREEGKSASEYRRGNRPRWDDLVRSLDRFDAVIGWKQDRLGRDEEEWHGFVKRAGRAGVRIITVADGTDIDPDDPELLAPSVKAMVAAQESRNTSKRVKRALAERAKRGDAHGGLRRYGYRRSEGGLIVVPKEAKIVREAAARVIAGESLNVIANDLTKRGIATVTGGGWRRVTLRGVLTGSTVNGRRTPTSEVRWGPILSDETWAEVGARLSRAGRGSVTQPGHRLLRGFVHCARCGARLVGASRTTSGVPDYVCARPADGGCGGIRIAAEALEGFVTEVVIEFAATPEVRRALDAAGDHCGELDDLSRRLRKLEQRADQVAADYGAGLIDRRTLKVATESNDRERGTLERRVQVLLSSSSPILAKAPRTTDALRRWWDDATEERRRSLIDALVERIDIRPGRRGPHAFQEDRVVPIWRGL